MAGGGYIKFPNGSVVVALWLPRPQPTPSEEDQGALRVRVLVHAANRTRALTRLRDLGLRGVYLRGHNEPPTPDEVTAVLHHPDSLVWRADPDDGTEPWHPIRSLLRPEPRTPAAARPRAATSPLTSLSGIWAWEGVLAEWTAAFQPPGGDLDRKPTGLRGQRTGPGHCDEGCGERR